MAPRSFVLPRRQRLLDNYDYKKVQRFGNVFTCPLVSVQILQTKRDHSRFGIITSTRLTKKAVERNRIKRLLREALRLNTKNIKGGYDVVIIPRRRIKTASLQEIQASVLRLLAQGGVL